MSLRTRARTLLAKIESSYGVDPTPTGASNAILVSNLTITPQQAQFVGRELIRPYFGHSEEIATAISAAVEFECELAGSGTAGVAPAWGPLLRACAFREDSLGSAHTGTAQAGGASTITLAAGASATDDDYNGMTIVTTGGTGSGQTRVISDYVGSTKVATVSQAWTTPPDATTTYSIGAQTVYQPITDAIPSVTMYFNADGVRHKLTGARGTVSFALDSMALPKLRFRFQGLYTTPDDSAAPSVSYTGWVKPVPVNGANTGSLAIHGYSSAVMGGFSFDMANQVVFDSLIGVEEVIITDRQPQGSISIEATTVAAKDWWTLAKEATTGPLTLLHGTAAGNKVKLDLPAASLSNPTYEDRNGKQMLRMGLRPVPGAVGNDEVTISVQ